MSKTRRVIKPERNEAYEFHPSQLTRGDRSHHVVESMLAYNQGIIHHNPRGASLKFQTLASSRFSFMRGTADLMCRDLYGTDADKAIALCVGDVHLENYGVMETSGKGLVWGVNDFDEANFAPFSWDVKRGATSVILAARDPQRKKRFSKDMATRLAFLFAESYLDTVKDAADKKINQFVFTSKDSPKEIREILEDAAEIDEQDFLKKYYLNPKASHPQFRSTKEIERIEENGALRGEAQQSLNAYLTSLQGEKKYLPKSITLLDIATKRGSGTASLGLWRYYALVELYFDKKKENKWIILEMKQERKSVLAPYVSGGLLSFPSEGSRVAYAENVHLPDANPYYGYTEIGGISYLVRKRSPHKKRVNLQKLTKEKAFIRYVEACGKALAFAHLQSDSILKEVYPQLADSIMDSVYVDTFGIDISGFATKMARQIKKDWKSYRNAVERGLFTFSEKSAVQ